MLLPTCPFCQTSHATAATITHKVEGVLLSLRAVGAVADGEDLDAVGRQVKALMELFAQAVEDIYGELGDLHMHCAVTCPCVQQAPALPRSSSGGKGQARVTF